MAIGKGRSPDPQPFFQPLGTVAAGLSCAWSIHIGSKLSLAETKSFHTAAGRRAGIRRAGIQRAVALSPPRPPHFASSLVYFLPFRCYKAVKERYIHWVLEHWAEPTETWEDIINVFPGFFHLFHHASVLPCHVPAMLCCEQMLGLTSPPIIWVSAQFSMHPPGRGCHGDKVTHLRDKVTLLNLSVLMSICRR